MIHNVAMPPALGESLAFFAERLRRDGEQNRDSVEARITASLAPIIRVALRRGVGIPSIVAWARRTHAEIAGNRVVAPDQYATEITRMLCSVLMKKIADEAPSQNAAAENERKS
jgi:hypothetical protein